MIIERNLYLNKLIERKHNGLIKVITGIRRCGKSFLLFKLFKNHLLSDGVKEDHIIEVNFDDFENEKYQDPNVTSPYLKSKIVDSDMYYFLLDEIQLLNKFEAVLNGLLRFENVDIYVTGSNAFLLSSDLATLFTGRTYEIEVYPFSFAEYVDYYKPENVQEAFDSYLIDGGMSGSYAYKNQEERLKYIADVYDTLIVRDIRQKYKIRNIVLMDKISEFMMDNISNITSSRKLADTLTHNLEKINHKTVGAYQDYLCNAYAFYKVRRYDIRGKKYLASSEKYYLSDHSFRYAKLGTKNYDYGRVMENIVAIELLRRGYEVYVGVLYKKEIDFVAIKRSEKIYIQVADDISGDATFNREVDSLLKIKDAYPRMLIARTRHEKYQYEGIQIIDITEWLYSNHTEKTEIP